MKAIALEFEKYQGSGNDFVLIDEDRNPGITHEVRTKLSRILMDRHFSVGADSILFVGREGGDIRYRIFEAGAELEMCGNGLSCAAAYYLSRTKRRVQSFITRDDVVRTVTRNGRMYTADLGSLQPLGRYLGRRIDDSLRMACMKDLIPGKTRATALRGLGVSVERGFFINPSEAHVVFLVDDISAIDLGRVGDIIAAETRVFPETANVNICQRDNQRTIRIRTYERGKFKETLACGTGSAASAFVAKAVFKLRGREIRVINPGGDLYIRLEGHRMFLAGPAEKVFQGTIRLHLRTA